MRQNMLMHGVPYKEFTVFNDDTIEHDNFGETKFQNTKRNILRDVLYICMTDYLPNDTEL